MDNLDNQIEVYLNNFAQQALTASAFASLSQEEKEKTKEQIRNYLNQVITDTLIDNLTDEQIDELTGVDFDSEQGEQMVALMAARVPGFMFIAEKKLQEAVSEIQQTGKIPATSEISE